MELQPIQLAPGELPMNTKNPMSAAMEIHLRQSKRQEEIANELKAQNPALAFITAYIMAGDYVTAEVMTDAVINKLMTASDAVNRIGSYARFQWAVANLPKPELMKKLLELWRGSAPDDTNLEYLELFRERAATEKRGYAADGLLLPQEKDKFLVYRGQQPGDPRGFSWTLDKETAVKFANGAGLRVPTGGGVIYNLEIDRECILAYITGRGEAEIIVDIERAGLI